MLILQWVNAWYVCFRRTCARQGTVPAFSRQRTIVRHLYRPLNSNTLDGRSFNYTGPANRLNDENIVILSDLDETRPESIATQMQFASYALAEIDRIIANHT